MWCNIVNKKHYCVYIYISNSPAFASQVVELETRLHEFLKEKEHMQLVHKMQEETAASVLQEKMRSVQAQCQDLLDKVGQLEFKCECS